MAVIEDLQNKYLEQILQDFKLQNSSAEEQQEVLEIFSQRLLDVAVITAIKMMNSEQQEKFSKTINQETINVDALTSLTAEIPELEQAIEQALQREYEVIKENF